MSMYKTIFVEEEVNSSGEQVFTINGEVSLYGDSAFSSLNDAVSKVAAVDTNAVVIKVASGKYDSYVVIDNGAAGAVVEISEVVAVNFGGGEVMSGDSKVAVAAANFTADEQAAIVTNLNAATGNSGVIYTADSSVPTDSTMFVSNGEAAYQAAGNIVYGNSASDIVDVITNVNNTSKLEAAENKLLVSAAYDENTVGWGQTHFASFVEALKNVSADTDTIKISGEITESAGTDKVSIVLSKDLSISGGKVNWEGGSSWIWFKKADSADAVKLNFDNFSLDGTNTKIFYFGDKVTATIGAGSSITMYNGAAQAGAVVKIEEGGELLCVKDAFQVQATGELKANLIIEGAEDFVAAEADISDRQAYIKYSNVDGNVQVTNGFFAAYDYVNVKTGGSFTANNSLVEIGANENRTWHYNPTGNAYGQLKVQANSEVTFENDSVVKLSGHITNNGTINIDNSTFIADGTIVSDGVVKEAQNKGTFTNSGTVTVSGDCTLNIAAASGNRIQIADGATLVESTIGGGITSLGTINVQDIDNDGTGLTISGAAYFGGSNTSSDTFSGGISGDDVRINSTLLLWNGTYTINANVSTVNMYLSSYDAKTTVGAGYTVSSDVCTWIRDTVTLEDGAKLTAGSLWLDNADAALIVNEGAVVTVSKDNAQNLGLKNEGTITVNGGSLVDTELGLTNSGTIDLNDGSIQAVKLTNSGTINLSVSAEKLASVTKDAYVIVEQTKDGGMVTDGMTVSVAGTDRLVGATWEDKGVTYSLTNGDGNDIVLKAQANVLTVDASYTEETAGFGFNKFNDFMAAFSEAINKNEPIEIKLTSDAIGSFSTKSYGAYISNDISVTADEKYTLTLNAIGSWWNESGDTPGTLTFGKNIDVIFNSENKNAPYWGTSMPDRDGSGKTITLNIDGSFTTASGVSFNIGELRSAANTTEEDVMLGVVNVGAGAELSVNEQFVMRGHEGAQLNLNGTADERATLKYGYATLYGGEINASHADITAGSTHVGPASSVNYGGAFSFNVNDDSVMNVSSLEIKEGYSVNVSESTLNAGSISNNGTFGVTGNSTVKVNELTSTKNVTLGGADDRSTLTLGSVNGKGASINATRLNIYNADVTLTDDVSVGAPTNVLHKIQDSTIDMGGNTLSYKGFTVLDSYEGKSYLGSNEGVTLKNGEFKVTDSEHLCFQGYDHVIAEDAVVNFDGSNYKVFVKYDGQGKPEYSTSTMVNVYGSLTVKGKLNVTHNTETNHGYDNVGTTNTGWGKEKYPESVLTVSGANAAYTIENGHMFRVAYETKDTGAGTMIVENGASFSFTGSLAGTGLFYNANKVYVDAASSFTVGSYYGYGSDGANDKKGAFNSETAGEMVILGNVTVNKSLTTDTLVIKQGAALNAGTIKVENLELTIGGSLALGNGTSVVTESITVAGDLVPSNAEFVLATGWNSNIGSEIVYKGVTYTLNGNQYINGDTLDANEYFFTVTDGKLTIAQQDAVQNGIYVGEIEGTYNKGDKVIVNVNGQEQTYTYGVDAFTSMEEAAGDLDAAAKEVVSTVVVNKDYSSTGEEHDADKVAHIFQDFSNVSNIIVSKDARVEDTTATAVQTKGDLNLTNDGHFEAKLDVQGDFTFTNTSVNTLSGEITALGISGKNTGAITNQTFEAENYIDIDNTSGSITDTTLKTAGMITIAGGNSSNVTVEDGALELKDTESFELNANSGMLSADSSIILDGSANLSVNGDNTGINAYIGAFDHTGKLTLNGEQTYQNDIAANKIEISANSKVSLEGTADFNELNILGSLSADFTAMNSYSEAGKITGNGTLESTHTGDWVINDSLVRDVSEFAGNVTLKNDDAVIVMGKGDFDATAEAKDSYFGDNATITLGDKHSVVLAGNSVNTGIDFKGTGTVNVGSYDNGFVDGSNGFSQTLSGNNSEFTGTVNVSEGAELTVSNALGASSINMNYNGNANAIGDTDDTKLILNQDGLKIAASITGDANDVIDVKENATLTGTGALNNFAGTVNVADNKAVTLNGTNSTAAEFVGGETAEINVNAATTLKADNTDFDGTLNLDSAIEVQFDGDFGKAAGNSVISFNANGSSIYVAPNNTVEINSTLVSDTVSGEIFYVGGDATLSAAGALNNFDGVIRLSDKNSAKLTLKGNNTTDAYFMSVNGNTAHSIVLDGGDLTLTADNALNYTQVDTTSWSVYDFTGIIDVNSNTLTIAGENKALVNTFAGDADGKVSFTANNLVRGQNNSAFANFNGTISIDNGVVLSVLSSDTTAAKVSGSGTLTFANSNHSSVKPVNTFSTAGAFNNFTGTLKDVSTLVLGGENTTSATVSGYGTITANADQSFTGDVSGFKGAYNIAETATVTLSGTLAGTISAGGGTLTLSNTNAQDIIVKAFDAQPRAVTLNNLNFGVNNITLAQGNFVNVTGSGSVKFSDAPNAHTDNTFDSLVAGDVTLTGGRNISATTFDGDINITISAADDNVADVTTNSAFGDSITITITDHTLLTGNDYNIISASSYTVNSITLKAGTDSVSLALNDSVKLGGYTYSLREKNGVWILDQRPEYSNFVVVNGAWGTHKYDSANDNGYDRAIGYDAAQSLDLAAEYIKGRPNGMDWGTNNGDAKIELTAGKYTLSEGKFLMTADNGVTQMTVAARDNEAAAISGTLRGSNGTTATELTIENVQITGNVAAGGKLVIDNSDAARSTGTYIAGGVSEGTNRGSSVGIKGGDFANRFVMGGSYVADGKTVSAEGTNSVTIANAAISGNVYGGSYVAKNGTLNRVSGDTCVTIDATNEVTLRGNIFAGDYATTGGTLTYADNYNGTAKVVFKGSADNLTFTGSVNGSASDKVESIVVFAGFTGKFNGSLKNIDTVTISGNSALQFGRRQANAGDTNLEFVVAGKTGSSAMYTVRDKNAWEFGTTISVSTDGAAAGSYVLVDNYAGGFDGFTFVIDGMTCSVNQSIVTADAAYSLNYTNNQLSLKVDTSAGYTNSKINTTEDLQLVIDTNSNIENGIKASQDAEVSVKISSSADVEIGKNASGVYEGIQLNNSSSAAIDVAEDAKLTIYGNITSVNQAESGDNSLVIGKNAEVTVLGNTDCDIQFGLGSDMIQLGEGSSLKITNDVNEKNSSITGTESPSTSDVFKMAKGSSVEAGKVNGFSIEMNVDSVLKMSNTTGNTNGHINVVGVTELVLDPSTEAVAGAKGIFSNFHYDQIEGKHSFKVDSVDMVLGEAKRLVGDTTPETTDDVWASLSKVDGDLVVAWGRSSDEVDAALKAFGNDSSLIYGGADFGKSIVADAASLTDGGATADDFDTKKNNGQLA